MSITCGRRNASLVAEIMVIVNGPGARPGAKCLPSFLSMSNDARSVFCKVKAFWDSGILKLPSKLSMSYRLGLH